MTTLAHAGAALAPFEWRLVAVCLLCSVALWTFRTLLERVLRTQGRPRQWSRRALHRLVFGVLDFCGILCLLAAGAGVLIWR